MKYLFYLVSTLLFAGSLSSGRLYGQPSYQLTDGGKLSALYFSGCDTVKFHPNGEFAGPALLLNGKPLSLDGKGGKYSGSTDAFDYGLEYSVEGKLFAVKVRCRNSGKKDLQGLQFSLLSGVNTVMDFYPAWRSIYFPSLLRCERTHFWGYLMNPNGSIVTLASPDPVASYRLLYNNHKLNEFGSGHLIRSFVLDLLNPQPLPSGHPPHADRLKAGETKSWTIYFGAADELAEVIPAVSAQTGSAVVTADLYTVAEGETVKLTVHGKDKPQVNVSTPDGKRKKLHLDKTGNNTYGAEFSPVSGTGVYHLTAVSNGKTSAACLSVRHKWSDYIKSSRRAALKYRQKTSPHEESWLGLIPATIAEEYFPDRDLDEQTEEMFKEIFPLIYDPLTGLPAVEELRIQNHAIATSLRVQRYKAKKDIEELRAAARLADFLISVQTEDGAYRNGKTHYTSVHYIAKSIMEVMAEEEKLAGASIEWRSNRRRHYNSVKRAIDELARNRDNIQTEGELTFEDGMISCSYTQLAAFALLQPKGSPERKKYIEAAEFLYQSHRCLSQHLIPDSRVHGASIRFWESQYDIMTWPNFVNSPHGWSAWRIYGIKYLYEETGKEEYLLDMMNALGACAQLLNPSTNVLQWAFVCDPYVEVKYFVEDENNKGKGVRKDSIVGQQYLSMISDWYRAPRNTLVSGYHKYDGGCCDNDVHEIFKCMGEIALTSAYFHLRPDGTYIAWNCSAKKDGDQWKITPAESCVRTIYANTAVSTENNLLVKRVGN